MILGFSHELGQPVLGRIVLVFVSVGIHIRSGQQITGGQLLICRDEPVVKSKDILSLVLADRDIGFSRAISEIGSFNSGIRRIYGLVVAEHVIHDSCLRNLATFLVGVKILFCIRLRVVGIPEYVIISDLPALSTVFLPGIWGNESENLLVGLVVNEVEHSDRGVLCALLLEHKARKGYQRLTVCVLTDILLSCNQGVVGSGCCKSHRIPQHRKDRVVRHLR